MMKKSGVKKMQAGGRPPLSAEKRAANRAANAAKRQANYEASMARQKAARDARMAALAKPGQERIAGFRAASQRLKEATAASRARRGMKSGGDVKKYAGGGSIYRKAADGIATKGKTRGMEVRMAKGGKC